MIPDSTQIRNFLKELWKEFKRNAFDVSIRRLKSPLCQFIDLIRLRVGPGKISPEDYYRYNLYDNTKFNEDEKYKFMSKWHLPDYPGKTEWRVFSKDKFLFYETLKGLGAPVPKNYAFFHDFRGGGDLKVLRSQSDLMQFFINEATYPLIVKPTDGIYSKDFQSIQSYQPQETQLILTDGTHVSLDAFIQEIDSFRHRGMLFQELLVPHPIIEKLCGPKICTFRVITGVYSGGVILLKALWKIVVGGNVADNYWRGNMIAPVDPTSGEIGLCVMGMGKELTFHETHPDSGEQLTGMVLPDWDIALKKCLSLSSCLSGIPVQAWDIALTNRGPVFLEVNNNGSLFLPQLAYQKGFRDDNYEFFLQKFSQGLKN